MSLRVYLAGPSAELDRVREAAALLRAAGHEITEPWWEQVDAARARGWLHDADVPVDFMRAASNANAMGIYAAECMVALCRSEGGFSSGVAYEIGRASLTDRPVHSGLYIPIFVVGEPRNHVAIFDPEVTVVGDVASALALLERVAQP